MAGVIGNSVSYWQTWNFVVEIDGQPRAGFQKVTGIGVEFGVSQFMEGGTHGVASQAHAAEKAPKDVTLERGASDDSYFWDWIDSVRNGNADDLRNVAIVQQHGKAAKERFKLENSALSSMEAGDFDRASEDKNRIQKVVLKPQSVKREKA